MVESNPVNYSNFKWCCTDNYSSFVFLDNNSFYLYEILEGPDVTTKKHNITLSPTCVASEVVTRPGDDRRKYKNFVVNPDPKYKSVVASYQQKLIHIDLENGGCDDILNFNLEKRSAAKRINLLDWSTIQKDQIAISIDKSRTLRPIYITDIQTKRLITENGIGADGESIKSMKWSPHRRDMLAVTSSKKCLEIFDIRSFKEPGKRTTDIQEIEGVCFSPKYEHIIATHSEENIKLWDIRYLKNTHHVYQEKVSSGDILLKMEWCKTHPTRLSFITKSARHIHIRDFPSNTLENNTEVKESFTPEQLPHHRQKGAPGMKGAYITNFSWHPFLQNRILCCKHFTETNIYKLDDISLYEVIIPKFTPSNNIIWGCSNALVDCKIDKGGIADSIEQRIRQGYVFNPTKNKEITKEYSSLSAFWKFFEEVEQRESLIENSMKLAAPSRSRSLHARDTKSQLAARLEQHADFKKGVHWLINSAKEESSVHMMDHDPQVQYYKSSVRNKSLEICGWPPSGALDIRSVMDKLCQSGEYNKSVAMTLFYQGVKAATAQLTKVIQQQCSVQRVPSIGARDDEILIALRLALSGFTHDTDSLWSKNTRESNLLSHMTDPYHRALFKFLTAERKADDDTDVIYGDILEDKQLLLEDRVAFACRFLPDIQLQEYIEKLQVREIQEGNVRAVVLTGVTGNIVHLMESYMDRTSDVQTVCLTLSLAKKYNLASGEMFNELHDHTLYHYLQYFDMKKMWIERAQFENKRKELLKASLVVNPHITIRCTQCGKSISVGQRNHSDYQRAGKKLTKQEDEISDKRFCPHNACNSLLPKCSMCMYNLGTNSKQNVIQAQRRTGPVSGRKTGGVTQNNPLNLWFMWCLHCQHGGHSQHINDWFMEHKHCPVPNCQCKCKDLDMAPSIPSLST